MVLRAQGPCRARRLIDAGRLRLFHAGQPVKEKRNHTAGNRYKPDRTASLLPPTGHPTTMRENRKSDWMQDEVSALRAQDKAQTKAEWVWDNRGTADYRNLLNLPSSPAGRQSGLSSRFRTIHSRLPELGLSQRRLPRRLPEPVKAMLLPPSEPTTCKPPVAKAGEPAPASESGPSAFRRLAGWGRPGMDALLGETPTTAEAALA